VKRNTERPNKGMKQTSVEHIGRSQLIPGVRRTVLEGRARRGWRVRVLRAVVVAASSVVCGCVGACDIFGVSTKELAAGYCLELNREFSSYRLQKCFGIRDAATDGVGLLEGTVERIGWNDRYIAGWRTPAFGRDRAGWMLLDTTNGRIEGPFSDAEFDALRVDRPALRGIVTSLSRDVLR